MPGFFAVFSTVIVKNPEFKDKEEYETWKADRIKQLKEKDTPKQQESIKEVSIAKECRYCSMAIPQEAKICPYCSKKQARGNLILQILLVSFVIIFAIPYCLGVMNKDSSTQRLSLNIGDKGLIDSQRSGFVILAIDENSFEQVGKIAEAKDYVGLAALGAAGQTFIVDHNTAVLILDIKSNIVKVRVLEGERIGQAGWIYSKFIRK
jgi:hypothetical protein